MRRLSPSRPDHLVVVVLAAALSLAACADPSGPALDRAPALAKGGGSATTTGVSVTAASPGYGRQGAIAYPVTITGSGFDAGSTVSWERAGEPDANVTVRSSTVVSSTRIDVTIDIAADAELSFYDIAVVSGKGSKGVGTEKFEVTTAISIGTLAGVNTLAYDANDQVDGWSVVGYSGSRAFAWRPGQMVDLGPGVAEAIDDAGETVAGTYDRTPMVWTWDGATWSSARLPLSGGALGGAANGMASDASGVAVAIGGAENVPAKGAKNGVSQPRLWRRVGGAWIVEALPLPAGATSGQVRAINAAGEAVGTVGTSDGRRRVAFWSSDGTPTILPGIDAMVPGGIDGSGTVAAGAVGANGPAAYWTATVAADGARTWSGPHVLPGTCARAMGVDDFGRIAGARCLTAQNRYVSAVWVPPYTEVRYLTGLGEKTDAGVVYGMSDGGTRVVGGSPLGAITVGAVWENPFTP